MGKQNLLLDAIRKANVKQPSSKETVSAGTQPAETPVVQEQKTKNEKKDKKSVGRTESKNDNASWQRFSCTCSKAIVEKIRNIAAKEGFTVRQVLELFLQRGIEEYEHKHGVAKPKNKDIDDLL